LLFVVNAAVCQPELQAAVLSEQHGILVNLDGQFPGWRQYQCSWLPLRPGIFVLQKSLKNCQQKGGGLAGAGLCLSGHVLAGKRHR
jgi:hypothetical protein